MHDSSQATHEQARAKVAQIFRYLQALNELRNPATYDIAQRKWQLWIHELPNHPCIQHRPLHRDDNEESPASSGEDYILRVHRPTLTEPPSPPEEIVPWLPTMWHKMQGRLEAVPAIMVTNDDGEAQESLFTDDPRRPEMLAAWLARRHAWNEQEHPARQVMAMYEKLYALYAEISREAEKVELVLGNGLLVWHSSVGVSIRHPLLLQRLRLHFDTDIPQFRFELVDRPPEIYSAILRAIPDMNGEMLAKLRNDAEQGAWTPLGNDENANSFFRRCVTAISTHGTFVASMPTHTDNGVPYITSDPVIFTQQRTLGFSTALEAILDDLAHEALLRHALTRVVGLTIADNSVHFPATDRQPSPLAFDGESEEILLSKDANTEQLEIAQQLERFGAVLVQGPPGTGKTHTIANLIGHLLAQGKSILVTSQTSKALTVLHSKVVEPLQPLCVSILHDSNKAIEHSITAITERLGSASAEKLQQEADQLTQHHHTILEELHAVREQIRVARMDEYRSIVIAGQQYAPSDAARQVKQAQVRDGWIPTPVVADAPLPLSSQEVIALYHTNTLITREDELEIASPLPDLQQLLTPADFTEVVHEFERHHNGDRNYRHDLWNLTAAATNTTIATLSEVSAALPHTIETLNTQAKWQLAAIADGYNGDIHRKAWADLIDEIAMTYRLAAESKAAQLKFRPEIDDHIPVAEMDRALGDIIQHLKRGGSLNRVQLMLHSSWKTLLAHVFVRKQAPQTLDEFCALHERMSLQSARRNLVDRWNEHLLPLGGPDATTFGECPEDVCQQFAPQLQDCLDWYTAIWKPIEHVLIACGLRWEVLIATRPVVPQEYGKLVQLREAVSQQLPLIIQAHIGRLKYDQARLSLRMLWETIDQLHNQLHSGSQPGRILQGLYEAIQQRDTHKYTEALQRLVRLQSLRDSLQQRQSLLHTLSTVAPRWAIAIEERAGIHGNESPPGDAHAAWLWRQLYDELERRNTMSLADLQAKSNQLKSDLKHTTGQLVAKKAWAAQLRNITPSQQQALQDWKYCMRKIGKGTGKHASQWASRARNLMPICQTCVPVWIMPLTRVVENFDPRRNQFDVVIIDEASQADVMALIAVYMGKQIVVVGDDEQVSPLAVGQQQDQVNNLIDEHLAGIPAAEHYDGMFSIYDLASMTFKLITLREHFRCVPEIIQFSNDLSYSGRIKPLRDASTVRIKPATIAYRVNGASRNSKTNRQEALVITSLLVAATEQPEYDNATFGVISMVGDEQAYVIDEMLRKRLTASEYEQRRIQCGNAAHFQGDERDVIFLSLVDVARDGPLRLMQEGSVTNKEKKRFNVAVSRARDQLWVVHSLDPENDLKPGDLRRRLIQYMQNPSAIAHHREEQEASVESEFERQVLLHLTRAGYHVVPQWQVGAYRIDLVVEGAGKRLAIECDGDRYHNQDNLIADMARQAILERLGWKFVRIRGSQFFHNADGAMQPVLARLQDLGIPPDEAPQQALTDTTKDVLKERVMQRAAELQRHW